MYETFYGLRERPFDLTPNPRFLLLTPGHRRALINLELGIATRKGVVALIGEPGTGKTTVARALMAKRGATTTFVYLNQSLVSPADLRRSLVQTLHLRPEAENSNTDLVRDLTRQLASLGERGSPVALIVDEAQSLPDDLLEEIRLLTNIETTEGKLMTLLLIGQPKLAARLNEEKWKQLKQRIEIRTSLSPLELPETAAYIWSRVRTAGGDAAKLFTADAIRLIHERARGIPRSISVIGENALIAGFADHERPVTRRLVQQVCADLDLTEEPPEPPQAVLAATAAPAAAAAAAATTPLPRRPEAPKSPPAPTNTPTGSLPRRDLPVARTRPAKPATTSRRWWFFSGAWLRS
jgi:general secretion pathway protein A